MTSRTQKFRTISASLAAALAMVACTPAQNQVGLTPPSADFQPVGLDRPSFGGSSIMGNPPMQTPMPPNALLQSSLVNDDEDDVLGANGAPLPKGAEPIIQNNPNLTPSNLIELQVVGTGVAPQNAISPAQSTALAKRAAMIDAYKLLGEKMYGIKLNGQDTVENMAVTSSSVKAKVQALVRGADVVNVDCKAGLCQVTMELKLDGRVWYRALGGR
ncbi:LPP20 family lipoprotein [Helicobacter sp. T3_23-1056]